MTHSQWRQQAYEWVGSTLFPDDKTAILRSLNETRPLKATFVIPEIYCPTGNARDTMHWTKAHELRHKCYDYMLQQNSFRIQREPLVGKPAIVLIRFTAKATDERSNWDKFPVDSLRKPKVVGTAHWKGLNYIKDDGPEDISLHVWCASGPKNGGFVYVRVYG